MYSVRSARLVLVTVGVATALATAITVRADQSLDQAAMRACENQLRDRFEDEVTFHLVRRKRYVDGMRLEVAARIDRDNSRFATCWVGNEEAGRHLRHNRSRMLAVNGPEPTR